MSLENKYDYEHTRMDKWSAAHNVHPEFLPFPHRDHDPWELLLEVQDVFDSLATYTLTWTWADTEHHGNGMPRERMLLYGAAVDAYPIREPGYKAIKFTNPQYANTVPQPCTLDPITHIERCASLGLVSGREVSRQFSKSHSWAWKYCQDRDRDWKTMREQGRAKMGNTMATAKKWTDWTMRDMGRALDIPVGTVAAYLNDYPELEEIPDPPMERWARDR